MTFPFQIGVRRLASGSRGALAASPVPGRGSGHEGSAGNRVNVRNATIGKRPEMHGSSRPAARPRTASRLDPYRRAVQPSLSRSRRIVRRDGERFFPIYICLSKVWLKSVIKNNCIHKDPFARAFRTVFFDLQYLMWPWKITEYAHRKIHECNVYVSSSLYDLI